MQNLSILGRAGLLASAVFFVAFILTLWPSRRQVSIAAVLYCAGIFINMGAFAYYSWLTVRMAGLIWPVWAIAYAAGAAILLWPSILQKKALTFGKILHLVFGLIPMTVQAVHMTPFYATTFEVFWFIYALLWLRIRENYVTGAQS